MNNPEGIKALVALLNTHIECNNGGYVRITKDEAKRIAESLTAVAEDSRAITALKVTLFETECYLPASIAKSVQAACAVAVAGDAEPSNLGEFVIALLIAGGYVTQAKVDEARKIALSCGPYEMPARQAVEGMVLVPRELLEEMAGVTSELEPGPYGLGFRGCYYRCPACSETVSADEPMSKAIAHAATCPIDKAKKLLAAAAPQAGKGGAS